MMKSSMINLTTNSYAVKLASFILAFACLASIPGCNIATPIAYAIHGPEKVMPAYTLDQNLRTVIFVDDPSSKIMQRRLRYAISERATKELLAKRVLVDMIDPRGVLTAASNERHGEQMSITDLGKSVGADIVIYAVVTKFSLSPETGSYLPQAELRVKVIDVAQGKRIWPSDPAGQLISIQIPQKPGTTPTGTADRLKVEQQLAERSGIGLSQLFYKHEITETVLFKR